MRRLFFCMSVVFVFTACRQNHTLFTRLSADETGIDFANVIQEGDTQFNILSYPYFYNGGGVAVGDINNDGLPDIVFTGNMVNNRLYLNKGNFKFEDITLASHIADNKGWSTGVTMADVNGDGWLDIYICRSGLSSSTFRRNLLFINNHDLSFTESAAKYGLADMGYSTQASFLDYDKDGDLDMMLINQSQPEYSKGRTDYVGVRTKPADSLFANKLFRNDNGHFTDVSKQAGIFSTVLSFSLGISTADINEDGWPDIYISNDFKEPDYLFINNHDGTFKDSLTQKIDHTSLYGMGIDVADYNNDQLPDIVQMDMLPEGNAAQKMHLGADNWDKFQYLFTNGMPYQYMKNSLQKNNGDGTFSEIGQLAGISNTDWSWSSLFGDFDNDGLKDLFISNGYKRDNTNMQFLAYSMNEANQLQQGKPLDVNEYIAHMPAILEPNYIYKNVGNDSFQNKIADWGFEEKTLSNGAIYADLDNDGDLDIITNDVDKPAGIYKNNSDVASNHYLRLQLKGSQQNISAIGTKVLVYAKGGTQYYEQLPTRGYQSCINDALHIGLGSNTTVDSIRVIWPDDKTQLLTNVKTNQTVQLTVANANGIYSYQKAAPTPFFVPDSTLQYTHIENPVNDFTRQFLLPYFYSHNGPCVASGDVNGDGLTDLYIGGSKGNAGALFVQDKNHQYHLSAQPAIAADAMSEDMDAVFFDANNDGKPDLYIASGGYDDYEENSPLLQDRLYLNDGKGNFTKGVNALPQNFGSKSCVRPCDIDGDGDMDLFVGGKVVPGKWPQWCKSSIYINDGHGKFTDETDKWNAALGNIGIVTSAVWADVNGDKIKDLIVVGEWMAPTIFENNHKGLQLSSLNKQLANEKGWWNTIVADDFDKDGRVDICVGNYGLNTQLKASEKEPIQLFATDVDNNGSIDPVMVCYTKDTAYPFVSMDDINGQIPALRKKFLNYNNFTGATIKDILPGSKTGNLKPLEAFTMRTTLFKNTASGFIPQALPIEAQYSPVYAIQAMDVNGDGLDDLLLFGNNSYNRIKLTRADANHGMVFINDGKGSFTYIQPAKAGIHVNGDIRSTAVVDKTLFIGVNNSSLRMYKLK